jgi:molecular chaperone DnaK
MKKVIGIDLGTTNSVVAFKDSSVRILRNKENEELTRSCVAIIYEEMLVGQNAYKRLGQYSINLILSIKRLMGGAIKDPMVQLMVNDPYYRYEIKALAGGTEDAVAVVMVGKQYTPEQISAEILKKLKADAEERLGDEVTHAVITVPAYFTEKQKNATKIAAQLAGLKVQKLLAEPTAAAIAYGVDNLTAGEPTTVLVYDFGGGTFDLSILNIIDGQYIETASGGDRWLGGDDIDKALQDYVLDTAQKQYKLKNIRELIAKLPIKKQNNFNAQLRFQTEAAKIQLSSAKWANVLIDNVLEDENDDIVDIDVKIDRAIFDSLVRPFVERTISLIDQLLKEANYDSEMIDHILLVGGTSCIPLIKEMLVENYGLEKIKVSEKPMLTVAEGAAILAHRLDDDYEPEMEIGQRIDEIAYSSKHTYYIVLAGDEKDTIVDRQTPLPVDVHRNYVTTMNNQKIIKVDIFAITEGGSTERQYQGFFTIEENLSDGSDIVFDIVLDTDEIFEIFAYPKGSKIKRKKVILGRGNKDTKALEFINQCLKEAMHGEFSIKQRDFFMKAAQTEIDKIYTLQIEDPYSEEWDRIGTSTFAAFEQAERLTEAVDEDVMATVFASILVNEYPDLLLTEDLAAMKHLLEVLKTSSDSMMKSETILKLQHIAEDYSIFITLFTVKVSADKAAKTNPGDAHRILQLHDQIVRHFRQDQVNAGMSLLNEAIELRDKYSDLGNEFASIDIAKKKP